MDVGKEQELRVRIFFWNARLELFKYVQLCELSLRFVQVVKILTSPTEGLALGTLDSACIHAATLENLFVPGGKVVADDRHHPHLSEVTCSQRKISCRASENVIHSAGGRGNGVKGYRTYHKNAHESPNQLGGRESTGAECWQSAPICQRFPAKHFLPK